MPINNLQGQKFGRLTVLERDLEKTGGAAYWICKCDCGTIKSIRGANLTTSTNPTRSCGCLAKEINSQKIDMTSQIGKKFGRLTVKERDLSKQIGHGTNAYWICECECGNITSVPTCSLKNGQTQSCGCLHKEQLTQRNTIDISNQQFGKLRAIKRLNEKNNKGDWLWECQCICGNLTKVATNSLTSGHTQSCGCKSTSIGEFTIECILQNNNIRYVREYTFNDLKSDKNAYLRFDFAILDENNQPIRLIEFNGEQHYKETSQFYTEQLIKNDQLKIEYAKQKNIPLVIIPYTNITKITLSDIL